MSAIFSFIYGVFGGQLLEGDQATGYLLLEGDQAGGHFLWEGVY